MKELKEVKIGKDFSEIKELAKLHFQNSDTEIPDGFGSQEFIELKKSFKNELSDFLGKDISEKILIATGHQPEFHHPGILWKDFLIDRIAKDLDGEALHINVDTDDFEIGFNYPVSFSKEDVIKKHFLIPRDRYGIFQNSKLNIDDKNKLNSHIREARENCKFLLSNHCLKNAEKFLTEIESNIGSTEYFSNFLESQRIKFLNDRGLQIHSIPVSFLASLPAFKIFVEKIQIQLGLFVEAFNKSLLEYRLFHKIKNPAQPLPEMKQNEMPFWILDNASGKRFHMENDDPIDNIIPKAITLTMFLRIFLSDFFIHGTGGGRYEAISDNVLLKFFGRGFCDYTISTATMNLNCGGEFSLNFPDEKEIDLAIRDLKHSPEKFLSIDSTLAKEKKELQLEYHDPLSNKKNLHEKIIVLNHKMGELLGDEKIKWETHRLNFPKYKHISEVFHSRDFPFFYYDIDELEEYASLLK